MDRFPVIMYVEVYCTVVRIFKNW